uniref:Uncharacterized protein n=1 Tax=Anguilla anguilla TaxID=7936 RepID=A0A0E9U2D1_ANGAN
MQNKYHDQSSAMLSVLRVLIGFARAIGLSKSGPPVLYPCCQNAFA